MCILAFTYSGINGPGGSLLQSNGSQTNNCSDSPGDRERCNAAEDVAGNSSGNISGKALAESDHDF